MYNDIYMLWLSSMVGRLSSRKLNLLLENFGTARNVFAAGVSEIVRVASLSAQAAGVVAQSHSLEYIEKMLESLQSAGIAYFPRTHERFPELLKEIPDPPAGIFCIGTLPSDNTHKVAVIGSRKCSEYGLMAARLMSKPLAAAGVVIVSGMARGVDSMAHRGAISGRGKTVAVLGCGVDICYPSENRGLREEIINNGCVISEYPPGTMPAPAFFPARNRIISGLSRGVVVTEAGKKSGTLITVNQAIEQGREVFAVPGNISSRLSEGTNQLIRDGATPVSDYTDILFALGLPEEENIPAENKNSKIPRVNLAPDEKQVYDSLNFEPVSMDMLMEVTQINPSRLHFICTQLEIKGLARRLPGSRYVKN
ncbi:MAG: DNA-processing protein DprA [Defluviitaleaceae bacterium]|nr:DNA-processing protein DprA [Defluviitaleaceae bacterium]